MGVVRHASPGNSTPRERLTAHPLVDRITDRTYVIKGGWARTFVFLPDPDGNRCVIIDPGTTRETGARYFERIGEVTRRIAAERFEAVDLRIHKERLRFGSALLEAIRNSVEETDSGIVDVFLRRVLQIVSVLSDAGLVVDAIYATHHHVDHLGVGERVRTELGLSQKVFLPKPAILRSNGGGSLPIHVEADMFETAQPGFEIRVIDISGHTEMVGFLLPDGSFIVGDLLGTDNMWGTSVLYMEDSWAHTSSLRRVLGVRYDRVLLSHGSEYVLEKPKGDELTRRNILMVANARAAVHGHEHPIDAAEAYLDMVEGDRNDFRAVLTTAMSIDGYR